MNLNDLEGSGCAIIELSGTDGGIPQKPKVGTVGVYAEIRTEHPPECGVKALVLCQTIQWGRSHDQGNAPPRTDVPITRAA
jgi:hypothetical protein